MGLETRRFTEPGDLSCFVLLTVCALLCCDRADELHRSGAKTPMLSAFDCFEWGMLEEQRSHPNGELSFPNGVWSHAVLSLKRTGADIGEAWFRVEQGRLTVDIKVPADYGGTDDPWLIRLVGDTLFGPDGFFCGYYDAKATRVAYRNLETSGVWDGTWAEMRGMKKEETAK